VQDLELEAHLRLELSGFLQSCFRLELVRVKDRELVMDLELVPDPDLELEAVGRRCFLQKPWG
jgi:hypothetical protein